MAEDIDSFMNTLTEKRQNSFRVLRELIKSSYFDIEEIVSNNIVSFKKDDVVFFAFGNQKQHMCFYFSKKLMLDYQDQLYGLNLGKGTIRFTDINKIDQETLKSIITDAKEFPFEFSKRGDSSR